MSAIARSHGSRSCAEDACSPGESKNEKGPAIGAEDACTPDSVQASEEAVVVISLGHASRHTSLRRCSIRRAGECSRKNTSRAVLLQVGFTRARVTAKRRALLPHDFTLTATFA